VYDCVDIDALVAEIAGETGNLLFDMTADGQVDLSDRDAWLAEAGDVNLGPGLSYRHGDANLDGIVDGLDFIQWNNNKFTLVSAWCAGDFNADGIVDGLDFIVWNENKFQGPVAMTVAPPNPTLAATRSRPIGLAGKFSEPPAVAVMPPHRTPGWLHSAHVDALFATSRRRPNTPDTVLRLATKDIKDGSDMGRHGRFEQPSARYLRDWSV
jgi:hypothetical protein